MAEVRGYMSNMSNLAKVYKDATKSWGVTISNTFAGYDCNDWILDIDLCVKVLNTKEEEAKLAKLEGSLGKIISPEQRRQIELEQITQELGNAV